MASKRWNVRPEGSNWGDFGPDDQLGRLNLVGSRKVIEGAQEVRTGKCFCLSLPLNWDRNALLNPHRPPPKLQPLSRNGRPALNFPAAFEYAAHTDIINDDSIEFPMQFSTHWDALCHVGQMFEIEGNGVEHHCYYNGYRAGIDVTGPFDYVANAQSAHPASGAEKLSISVMAEHGVQGRAVMVDLEGYFGREHRAIGYEALMTVLDTDNASVESGDILCIHTGFAQYLISDEFDRAELSKGICTGLDGRDQALLDWITNSGVAAIVADNPAVEFYPAGAPTTPGKHSKMPLHEHCLFKLGIHLGELWYLSDLNRWLRSNQRSRFLLTAPPLRFPGAVGSPVTPIGTV